MKNVLFCIFVFLLFSCKSTKSHMHFYEITDSLNKTVIVNPIDSYEPKIELGDILSINISTADFKNVTSISDANSGASTISSNIQYGYGIDSFGFIQLPLIGKLKVIGLTISQVKDLLTVKAREFYNDPILNVRLANFKITILGEVSKPGALNISNGKINILEAINLAGDILLTGDRTNLLLIRTSDNKKTFIRLNLNDPKIFYSQFFNLKQDDVIYVEATKTRIRAANIDQASTMYFSFGITLVSVLISVYTLIRSK